MTILHVYSSIIININGLNIMVIGVYFEYIIILSKIFSKYIIAILQVYPSYLIILHKMIRNDIYKYHILHFY